MGKVKRLPRDFWDSAKGKAALEHLQRREVTAADLARDLGTTEAAIYNAASKRRHTVSYPMLVNQEFVGKVIQFAEEILGEAVTNRLRALETEVQTLRSEKEDLLTQLDRAKSQLQESDRALEQFRQRVMTRVGGRSGE